MAKQTFTAGQVLTAAQMTSLQANDYNWTTSAQTASYVLTAANAGQTVTMTSASATTITVNTGLFTAGDRVSILNLGAGACTITAGTATVNTAGSLVLPQYGSGTLWFSSASAAIFIPDDRNAGLTLIKTQTVGNAVSSVQVTSAFSATYDSYKIIYEGGTSSASNRLNLTLGASATAYYWAANIADFTSAGTGGYNGNNATSWAAGASDGSNTIVNIDLHDPFLAKYSYLVANWFREPGTNNLGRSTGFHALATSYTDFTITPSTGTITGGTIRVYGYQNS